jgi:hypothetical protein
MNAGLASRRLGKWAQHKSQRINKETHTRGRERERE